LYFYEIKSTQENGSCAVLGACSFTPLDVTITEFEIERLINVSYAQDSHS